MLDDVGRSDLVAVPGFEPLLPCLSFQPDADDIFVRLELGFVRLLQEGQLRNNAAAGNWEDALQHPCAGRAADRLDEIR